MADIDPYFAQVMGLVKQGGDLSPASLLKAYRSGCFPWFDEGDPILWWSPDPRAIFEIESYHVPRRLARTIRSGKFRVTRDLAFGAVMRGCADRVEGTWITDEMLDAYQELHRLGHAHSVEAWLGEHLAGGVYGVALGGFFAAESMFHYVTDAGKVALASLIAHLRQRGFTLFDLQFINDHTARLGAIEIPRKEYLRRLRHALRAPATF
jgi:leucyl/phenylalanyl-tRNA--protein transferase